jgi:hypothetical protein
MNAGIFRLDEPFLRQIAALSNEKMAKYKRKRPSSKWRLIVSRYLYIALEKNCYQFVLKKISLRSPTLPTAILGNIL